MYYPTNRTKEIVEVLIYLLLMWAIFFIQQVSFIGNYGIVPREFIGLIGLISSPFLHADLNHLVLNTGGFVVFGIIYSILEGKRFSQVFWTITILQGLLTWIFAIGGNHIGASGVIFGLFSFLLGVGFFHRNLKYIVVSLLISVFYGSMIFGMIPVIAGENVSWEGHLFGFISGILIAKFKNN